MDNSQYLQAFLDESFENTQILNAICLKIEQTSPTDDDFAAMFRAAHTLKGMSATMGFTHMASLTHKLEDAMGFLREHPNYLTADVIDVLFASIDALENDLQTLRDGANETTDTHGGLIEELIAIVHGGASAAAEVAATAQATGRPSLLADDTVASMVQQCQDMAMLVGVLVVQLSDACQMKGVRAIMVNRALEEHGACLSCAPSAEVLESGEFEESTLYFLVALQSDEDSCVQSVSNISEITSVSFVPVEEWNNPKAEPEEAKSVTSADSANGEGGAKDEGGATNIVRHEKVDRTIRVPVERLDSLMNHLSELVIDKTRLASIAGDTANADLKDLSDHLSRIANDLQSVVMSLRMVPVDTLFQRFPRMVRDLSKTLSKDIRLNMTGMETEFDRTVIDEMGEVLVHLIRNSADHGLESTEERNHAGKPAEGTIHLRAYSSGQHVFIEVEDDGGGINEEKVLHRAVERGIVRQNEAGKLTSKQIFELLFESGFSTADTVSDISGRGVGLDAVRRKVESLGGRIDIESERGIGSTFRIQLPLTLSILNALLTSVDGDTFALPLGSVEEVVHVTESMLTNVHGEAVLNHAGKLIPILDLGKWMFGKQSAVKMPWKVVICKEGSKRVAIVVDQFVGQQEIVHKGLGTYLQSVPWFAGATILGDGRIALILDVHALIHL